MELIGNLEDNTNWEIVTQDALFIYDACEIAHVAVWSTTLGESDGAPWLKYWLRVTLDSGHQDTFEISAADVLPVVDAWRRATKPPDLNISDGPNFLERLAG